MESAASKPRSSARRRYAPISASVAVLGPSAKLGSRSPYFIYRRGPRRPPPNLPQNDIAPAKPALEGGDSGEPFDPAEGAGTATNSLASVAVRRRCPTTGCA